ncbi:hypothetical protein, partial [Bacteroides sp.]|uniref:hypothetical protein n=2 Tax=Bacteroides TaxID=816 RepID=UPI002A74E9B3
MIDRGCCLSGRVKFFIYKRVHQFGCYPPSFFSYVYKQVIPSCLLTRGDELSEKNGDYLLSH